MAHWSKNNRACKTTWSTLRILDQLNAVFGKAGDLKMKELTYYNQTSSKDQRASMARMLSVQLDNIFRELRGARYEDDITGDKAIGSMVEVLTTPDATVALLAEKCDVNYKFYGEEEDL
ncbi:MAG: hypothetical protein JW786_09815 [Desulfobacterales bacterium]|nr:hypothetical protein [Desulfobacterales bacterium]